MLGGFGGDAAYTRIRDGDARPGDRLDDIPELLASLDHQESGGGGTDLLRRHPEAGQVVADARDLAHYDADRLAARWDLDAAQPFDGQDEADVVDQRRDVVEPIGIADLLRPGALLAHLLEAAVQVADLDVAGEDDLAVELQVELDRAMGRRVGGAHLELHD